MDMNNNKVVNFIKNNKKNIAIGAGVLVGGVAAFALGKRLMPAGVKVVPTISTNDIKVNDIKVDSWDLGTLIECWKEGDFINAIVDDITVADTGKLGEQLLKIDGTTTDTSVSVLLAIPNNMTNQ